MIDHRVHQSHKAELTKMLAGLGRSTEAGGALTTGCWRESCRDKQDRSIRQNNQIYLCYILAGWGRAHNPVIFVRELHCSGREPLRSWSTRLLRRSDESKF